MRDHVVKQNMHPHLFWRAESKGYTHKIAFAGIYTAQEAKIIENNHRSPLDEAIPLLRFEDDIRRDLRDAQEEVAALQEKLKQIDLIKIDRANRHLFPEGGDQVG